MTKDSKFNWQVRGAALGIFLLGFVAGALALNAYHVWFSQSLSTATTKQQRFDRIFDQLSLSEPQKGEVQKILGETREEYKNVRKEPITFWILDFGFWTKEKPKFLNNLKSKI